jgi:hypothetical protein
VLLTCPSPFLPTLCAAHAAQHHQHSHALLKMPHPVHIAWHCLCTQLPTGSVLLQTLCPAVLQHCRTACAMYCPQALSCCPAEDTLQGRRTAYAMYCPRALFCSADTSLPCQNTVTIAASLPFCMCWVLPLGSVLPVLLRRPCRAPPQCLCNALLYCPCYVLPSGPVLLSEHAALPHRNAC